MQDKITIQSLIDLAKQARLSHSSDTKYYLRLLIKRLELYQLQETTESCLQNKKEDLRTAISLLNQSFKVATNTLELLHNEVLPKK